MDSIGRELFMLFHFLCKKRRPLATVVFLYISSLLFCVQSVYATPASDDAGQESVPSTDESRRAEEVDSNQIENWPVGPPVGAEGAVLIEANTGTVLYHKNMNERLYPASTTKILTALTAIENADLNEIVSFSSDAVFSIEKGSSNMGMDVGQEITMEQCLYGILVYSANEVCNAVAEHIAGSQDAFVAMMNERAAQLGCTNSHFVTTNGLHDENHYTTPYDLALIARAFFANETLAKIAGTKYYKIEPTAKQPDLIELYTHNQLTNGTYPYEGYIGGKTGYTSNSLQTLVSCAERNGMKLICVVMKEDSPSQFTDTIALFDYGFQNFNMVNVAQSETRYTVTNSDFFENSGSVFGESENIMTIDPDDAIVLPTTISFENVESALSYQETDEDPDTVASIHYSYKGISLGTGHIVLSQNKAEYDFDSPVIGGENVQPQDDHTIFINVITIIGIVVAVLVLLILLVLVRQYLKDFQFTVHTHRPRLSFRSRTKRPKTVRRRRSARKERDRLIVRTPRSSRRRSRRGFGWKK